MNPAVVVHAFNPSRGRRMSGRSRPAWSRVPGLLELLYKETLFQKTTRKEGREGGKKKEKNLNESLKGILRGIQEENLKGQRYSSSNIVFDY